MNPAIVRSPRIVLARDDTRRLVRAMMQHVRLSAIYYATKGEQRWRR